MATSNFRFTDPREERIYRRLLFVGAGPAALFKDACALMAGTGGLQTTPHIVAHLLREVESGLRPVLVPYGAAPGSGADIMIEGSHKQQVKAILAAYGIKETDPTGEAWLRLTGYDPETGLARLAHRRAPGPPRPADEGVGWPWEEVQNLLDIVLEKFETRFREPFKVADDLLARDTPSAANVKRLTNNVPNNPVTLGHFDKAENGIPIALRTEAWTALCPLTDDPNPTPEHEARYGGTNMDPPTLAINTVRGDAMHAVIEYALWIRRQFRVEEIGSPQVGSRFLKTNGAGCSKIASRENHRNAKGVARLLARGSG